MSAFLSTIAVSGLKEDISVAKNTYMVGQGFFFEEEEEKEEEEDNKLHTLEN
jgi:hypothetical protein